MIYQEQPEGFSPTFEVVSCFFEAGGEILLLHRQDHKPEGNTWGVPAGKVDQGETPIGAILRELVQETGHVAVADDMAYFQELFVRYPTYDFIYHMFHLPLPQKPSVIINANEHKAYTWKTPELALAMPLIGDLDNCIKLFYQLPR